MSRAGDNNAIIEEGIMAALNSEQRRAESEPGACSFMDVIGDCYSSGW